MVSAPGGHRLRPPVEDSFRGGLGARTEAQDLREHWMEKKRTVSEQILREIIRRIVEVAQPEKIVMFGSAARGEMGPHSDVDLLVVRSCAHRRKLAMAIYKQLSGVGCPVDVIVVTPEDIERYGSSPVLIIQPALKEGRVVYAA
jgi:uncharacterized protein